MVAATLRVASGRVLLTLCHPSIRLLTIGGNDDDKRVDIATQPLGASMFISDAVLVS